MLAAWASKIIWAGRAKPLRSDQEFLPAALEILETPASPNHIAFMLTICAFVVVSILWAYFGRIDIVAVAQGKIQPAGRIKVMQPVDAGRVVAFHVENGTAVKKGDLLVELDSSEAHAEEVAAKAAMDSFKAEALRRRAGAGNRLARRDSSPLSPSRGTRAEGGVRSARGIAGEHRCADRTKESRTRKAGANHRRSRILGRDTTRTGDPS